MIQFDFFQYGPPPLDAMEGYYVGKIVFLSYIVAVLASFVALEIAHSIRQDRGRSIRWRAIGGACAMGAGIFSMHFVGMLAFVMPMPMGYDFSLTLLSLVVAVIASGFAFFLIQKPDIRVGQFRFFLGGALLGIAMASMHYTGMAAMLGVKIRYIPSLFFLSLGIAIAASLAALWLMLKCEVRSKMRRHIFKICSALVMGGAIAGMHYTGMMAAVCLPTDSPVVTSSGQHFALSPENLSFLVAFIASCIMLITLLAIGYRHLIAVKMTIGFLIIPLLLVPLATFFLQNEEQTRKGSDMISNKFFPRIQALLEMKNSAFRIQTMTANFQNASSKEESSRNKDELFALMADLNSWQEQFVEAGTCDVAQFNTIKNNVTLSSLALIEAIEKGRSDKELAREKEALVSAEGDLSRWIEQQISLQLKTLQVWKKNSVEFAKESENIFLMVLGTSFVIATCASSFIAFQISRPILQFKAVSQEIADGNLHKKVPITTTDEIGELGKTFNAMVEALYQSNQKKDSMLSMAAHDLRNPLSVIIESSSLLSEELAETASDMQKQFLLLISKASTSMMQLLDDLLLSNSLGSTVFQIQQSEVNLRAFFQGIFDFNNMLAKKKKINFSMEMHLGQEAASFDAAKIEQVVSNLLTNAFKFSNPYSAVQMIVREFGERLRVEIHDEGKGIPKEEQERVFVPFAKLSVKPTGGETSHGLGLAICKDIITAHNGMIGFQSVPGKGSIFYFELNLQEKPSSSCSQVENSKKTDKNLESIH